MRITRITTVFFMLLLAPFNTHAVETNLCRASEETVFACSVTGGCSFADVRVQKSAKVVSEKRCVSPVQTFKSGVPEGR
jgi:hypothetical protein